MAVTLYASGTSGQTVGGGESFLSSPNVAGRFQLILDLNLMAAGDYIEVRAYKMALTGGTQRVAGFTSFSGAQPTDGKIFIPDPIPNTLTDTNAVRFGINQPYGTARAFPFAILNLDDYTTTPATADVTKWNGTAVSSPATAGIPEVNVKNINNVSTSVVTTVKAVQGLTTADVLSATGNNAIADALRARQMTEGYAADGVAPTVEQAIFMMLQTLQEFSIAGTTITVKKIDKSTTAMTFTMDNATTPTSRTRAT